jgi:beta-glucanase (GH16 family)
VVNGAWPAFWLIPAQDARGENIHNGVKETGEIDIFEGQGDHPNTFYGTIHDWIDKHHTTNNPNWYTLPKGFKFSTFHTYGLLWVPGKVTWYLDDRELYSAPTPAIVDKQDFFIVLGSQEGANWEAGSLAGVDAERINLSVDWVRIWQK